MNLDTYIQGDKLKYQLSWGLILRGFSSKCTFEEYEMFDWTGKPWQEYYDDHCCWVTFDRIGFKKNKSRLVCLSNLKRYKKKLKKKA